MPGKQGSGTAQSRRVFGHPGKRAKTGLRAGLYARVSTHDQQSLPMQNRAMREYAARRGWTIAIQVKELGSGAAQRQMREKLIEAARRRDIDVVLVWRLDRWGRSVTDLLATLQAGVPSDRSSSLGWRNWNIWASASSRSPRLST